MVAQAEKFTGPLRRESTPTSRAKHRTDELGINLVLGGHYATETFGVKALAAELSQRFEVPWEFLDYPTGL